MTNHDDAILNTSGPAARIITDALPNEVRLDCATYFRINPEYHEVLAETLQGVIANVIAHIIDAGSERDAVNEDEALTTAIINTLKEW